jgi:dTDP-4-dehydrorhamnose 3,5-epimerase
LTVPGAFVFRPTVFDDDRGSFREWYRQETVVAAVGRRLDLAQANWSTSRRGVVRGLHYADVPPGQAKYVVCVRGAVLDVVVDLRVGSPTFGEHAAVRLGEAEPAAVYLAEGLGHAFCALTDDATVLYLCSTGYRPAAEHGVHPLDPDLGLPWPADVVPRLSPRDTAAPSLEQALAAGALPRMADCERWYTRPPDGAGAAAGADAGSAR